MFLCQKPSIALLAKPFGKVLRNVNISAKSSNLKKNAFQVKTKHTRVACHDTQDKFIYGLKGTPKRRSSLALLIFYLSLALLTPFYAPLWISRRPCP
jgi:hypothetical protein